MSDDPIVAVRRDPHFARSLQFLIFFHPAFPDLLPDLPEIRSEACLIVRLEWLLAFETDSTRLAAPFCALAKPLLLYLTANPFTKLTADTILSHTTRLLDDLEWPVDYSRDATTLLELSVSERCRLLCDLIEVHLADPQAFRHIWSPHVKDGESSWRLEPVGRDHSGRLYYVFDDGRLYRQKPGGGDPTEEWELLAASTREWNVFLESGLSSRPKDKQLVSFLRNEIFPDTLPILEQVEQEERRLWKDVEISSAPRKRSSRLQAIKEADQQRKQREEERAREEKKRARLNKEAHSILPLASTPPTGKSREERLRERELKKLIQSQPIFSSDDVSDVVEDVNVDEPLNVVEHSSPLRLVLKKTPDGYHSSLITSDTINHDHSLADNAPHTDTVDTDTDTAGIIDTVDTDTDTAGIHDNSDDEQTRIMAPHKSVTDDGNIINVQEASSNILITRTPPEPTEPSSTVEEDEAMHILASIHDI